MLVVINLVLVVINLVLVVINLMLVINFEPELSNFSINVPVFAQI